MIAPELTFPEMDDVVFSLESICAEDLHCVILPSEGQSLARNNAILFYPMSLRIRTLGSYPFTFQVLRNYFNDRPQMGIEASFGFRSCMSKLDTVLADRFKQAFPNLTYRPIVKENSSFIYFSLPSFKSSRQCVLHVKEMDNNKINDDKMMTQYGYHLIHEKWHDKYCDAFLEFDFSCVFVKDGTVGCNPRLLKIWYIPSMTVMDGQQEHGGNQCEHVAIPSCGAPV